MSYAQIGLIIFGALCFILIFVLFGLFVWSQLMADRKFWEEHEKFKREHGLK